MAVLQQGCCFSLRVCSIIIGWFGLAGSILKTLSIIGLITLPQDNVMLSSDFDEWRKTPILFSGLGFGIVGIIMNTLMLIGCYKKNKLMLLPWIASTGICLVIMMILISMVGIYLLMSVELFNGLMTFLLGGMITALQVYFWMCVLSYYQEIKEEEDANKRERHEEGLALDECDPYPRPPPYK